MNYIKLFSTFVVLFILNSCKIKPMDKDEIDWGKLSQANSSFNLVQDSRRSNVWAIIQARILKGGSAVGGFCGSAWICKVTEECVIFATADHVVSEETFYSKKDNPVSVYVFLANADGKFFPITLRQVERYPNLDMAFIRISKPQGIQFAPLPMHSSLSISGKVYNIGFPDRALKEKDVHLVVDLRCSKAKFDKGPWIQSGEILSLRTVKTECKDVSLVDARCLILNYASEIGFSGGPLFSYENNCVVGMMSIVLPTKDKSPPTQSMALSTQEISGALQ